MKKTLLLAALLTVVAGMAFGAVSAVPVKTNTGDIVDVTPYSTTEYCALAALSATATGTWYDTGLGRNAWTQATAVVSGLSGAGATLWIDFSNGSTNYTSSGTATIPNYYDVGQQYGNAVVANGVYELPHLARYVKFRCESYTAGTVLVNVRLFR